MKRLSFVLALVAVLALAGTANAAPTFSGSTSLSLTGTLNQEGTSPYPAIGSPSLTLYIAAQDGSNWSLNGTLKGVNGSAALDDWKLTVNAGSVKFSVAENQSVGGDKQDMLGLLPAAAGNAGDAKNHLRVEVPVAPFTVLYDRVQGGADRIFIDAAAGTILPASLGVTAKVNVTNPTVVGYASYTVGNGVYIEAAAGVTNGKPSDALAYGAEVTIPVSSALKVYLVGKHFGTNFDAGDAGKTPTLAQITYTQQQYKLTGYFWRRMFNDGQLDAVRNYGRISVVQKAGDNLDWFNPDYTDAAGYSWDPGNSPGGSGYRSLKGLALYASYGQDAWAAPATNYKNLNVAVGSPVIPGKAYADVYVQIPGTATGLNTASTTTWGHLYTVLSSKLNSQTRVKLTKSTDGKYQADVWDKLTYNVSGSSSIALTLSKAASSPAIGYTTTFTVSF